MIIYFIFNLLVKMSKFTKESFNSFLKEYISYSISKPTENTIEVFNEHFNIKDGQILVDMVKHILFNFIQNEKLSEKEEINIFIYMKNLLNFFFNYENNNYIDTQDLNELTYIIYEFIWKSEEIIKSKTLNDIIIQSFKIIIKQKSKNENNNLLNIIVNDINKLTELSIPICYKILQVLKCFLKINKIDFNNEKANSIIIILNGILNVLINNLKNLQEEIFIENINLFKLLLDISIIGIKIDLFCEIYHSENNYFNFLQKTLINILDNIDNLQIKNNGNLINVNSTVLTFKRKIIKFLIVLFLKDPFSFNCLIEIFKFAIIHLNNLTNSFNVNEKIKNIGIEENNDLDLKYIKVILIFVNIVLKKRINQINELFKENAFDFIQNILLIFIDNELKKNEISDLENEFDSETILIDKEKNLNEKNKNNINFHQSIFSISLLIIKEIINIYPFILELICNLSFNLINNNKSYLGYFLMVQFFSLNNNINISNYIHNNIEMILKNKYNEKIDNSEITIYLIINFLYSFNQIIISDEEIYIKCLYYIYNNIKSDSIKIRKNCSIKLSLMIKEAKKKELVCETITNFIHNISYDILNQLIIYNEKYIDFLIIGFENYIFINEGSFLFSLFKVITIIINKGFNYNQSDILLNSCFNLLIQLFKNEKYNKTLIYSLNDIIDIVLQNITPLLQYSEINNYDDQIFEILFYLLNENIEYKICEIFRHLMYIPDYISKSNFMSNSIFKLLNLIIDKNIKDIKCNDYLQNIFNQIIYFNYKKQETSLIKITILLQCFVYSNKDLSIEFISTISNFAFNFIMESNNQEKSLYYFNTIFALISFVFSLFKNYHKIIIDIINHNFHNFIKRIEFYFTFEKSFNIIQSKFILFSLCNIINQDYFKENTFIFLKICFKLIYQVSLKEKNLNIEKQNNFIKSNFVKYEDEDDDDDLFEDKHEFDYELNEINQLYSNEENIITKWKNIDEFKIFSECFHLFYNKNKYIIEKELLMKMKDNEKKKLINLLHTNRIDSKNYENYNSQIKFNENGGIPRKIFRIKKKNNNALIELNNNMNNKMEI